MALDYLQPGEEWDPDLLQRWSDGALAAAVRDGESRSLALTVRP